MEIAIKDTLYNPLDSNKFIQRTKGTYDDKIWYRIWIYLEGVDLPYVKAVKYTLHPDIKTPPKVVYLTPNNPNCSYSFWTFGTFVATVQIEDYKGNVFNHLYQLEFDNELTKIEKLKAQLISLGTNHAGTLRLKKGIDINYGTIRVENDNFIHYTRKGLDEIFSPKANQAKAKLILALDEPSQIASKYVSITPISEIESILH